MTLKKFNAKLINTLNGVDTYSFDHVVNTASVATAIVEGADIQVKSSGNTVFKGQVKSIADTRSGYIRSVVSESPMAIARDTDMAEENKRGLTKLSTLLAAVLPEGFTVEIKGTKDPLIEYAFRSGSILSHLNTLCSMCGFNWRSELLTATTAHIIVSDDGAYSLDQLDLVENVDIFKLKIDKSLFKQYTQVTAVGVEPEVSGYTAVASLNEFILDGTTYPATFFLLDSDDGEIDNDEVPVEGYTYSYVSPAVSYNRLDLRYGADLKGWESNHMCLVNGEFIAYSSKAGQSLMGIQRAQWGSVSQTSHIHGDPCVLVNNLAIASAGSPVIQPATTLFKLGSEIISGEFTGNMLELATVDPQSLFYLGRGLEYSEFSGWVGNPEKVYAHKRGSVITPYYPDAQQVCQTATHLAITVHGKGIVTKDGLDRLAWGILRNTQNGILSGSGTFKSADFFDIGIAVGQKIRITTASTSAGANVIAPATTYECLIYSITRAQNSLMTIEFGNVIPEVLHMIKSGEYALQAAVRKTKDSDAKTIESIGVTGAYVKHSNGKIAKLG